MTDLAEDIYTEPEFDSNTLANLGPLTALAGVWQGTSGVDVHPAAEGTESDTYVERYELQPIDPQTNGPQLLYGLRYHTHITKPGEVDTFHDQVGYWLWEPATSTVTQTIAIPRAQVALLSGRAAPDATSFELHAERGAPTNGICSDPFLDRAFKTVQVRITVTVHTDGTWSYDEDTVMEVLGRKGQLHHTDRHTLTKVAEPTPNPMALAR
ncbi:MAG: FABP family protein [Acidimicrobiales bacterium]